MNAQRCWFFELPARRPALRIRSRCAGSSGRSANARIARRVAIAAQTGSSALGRRHGARSPAGSGSGRGIGFVAPGQGDLGERPEAARAVLDRAEALLGVRDPLGRTAAAALAGRLGRERAAERRAPGTRHRPRDTPGTRTATSAGRPRSGGSRRVRRVPAGRPAPTGPRGGGEPVQVGERHDGVVRRRGRAGSGRGSGRWPPTALTSRDHVAARPEVHARRQPGEGIGDRVGDRQVGEPERLAREPVRVGRRRRRDERRPTRGSAAAARIAPIAAHRVARRRRRP